MRLELLNEQSRHLPQSLTRKTINYTLERWDKLTAYTQHAEVEIDNNLIENAIRPIPLGRKNRVFIGGKEAGWRSAVIYTTVRSCQCHGIDPYTCRT